jgi:hypothetical protein
MSILNPTTPIANGDVVSSANAFPVKIIGGASSLIAVASAIVTASAMTILSANSDGSLAFAANSSSSAVVTDIGSIYPPEYFYVAIGSSGASNLDMSETTVGLAAASALALTGGIGANLTATTGNVNLAANAGGDVAIAAGTRALNVAAGVTFAYAGVQFASTVTGSGSLVGATNPTLSSLIVTGTFRYGGVTFASTVTGSGSLVGATNPTLSSLIATGTLTYGGVALASTVTGTGSMVLSAAPSITGLATFTSLSATGTAAVQTAVAASAAGGNFALQWSANPSFGIQWGGVGSVVPTVAGSTGSLFLNSTASAAANRMYVRSSASTWIAVTTAS